MTAAIFFNQRTGDYEVDKKEEILAFPADVLNEWYDEIAKSGNIVTSSYQVYQISRDIMNSKKLAYVERGPAETNPDLKQLIPYVVFTKGDKFFVYQRTKKSGETRLQELYSLGVGGHINPCDGETVDERTYWRAFAREIQEELYITKCPEGACPISAVIYDPSNEVGKVHFGMVHLYNVPVGTQLTLRDPALSRGQWVDRTWLSQNFLLFENWSKLVISRLL